VRLQFFRSGTGWPERLKNTVPEWQFFCAGKSTRARIMAEELRFMVGHLPDLKVVLVGASQGAAFNNAIMRYLGASGSVYSIELGTFFPHMKRRLITDRTLAIDSNGLMRDPMCQRDLWAGVKSYIKAFGRWFRAKAKRQRVMFTHLINTPGHEYGWEYPAVHTNITAFLKERFGAGPGTDNGMGAGNIH
jgi:hypothetical protein